MTVADHARELLALGLAVIPVPHKSKAATIKGWPDLRLTLADIPRAFGRGRANVGALLGEPSGWIVDVDLDDARAVELADAHLPPTGMEWGRAGNPRSHRLYRVTRPVDSRKWPGRDGRTIVELRSTRSMTLAPGSTHTSGETVRWDAMGEPARIEPDALVAAIESLARAVKFEKSQSNCTHTQPDTVDPVNPKDPADPKDPKDPADPVDPVRLTPEQVIERAAVTGPGQHDGKTLTLARGLKLHAGLTLDGARPWFDRWWADARPHCGDQDGDAALFKFERAWETARIPLGAPGVAARVLARLDTLPDAPEAAGFGPKLGRLVSALAAIGDETGGEPFALSARQVADAFGVSATAAHEWLRGIERRGLVESVDRGRPGANGTGRARRLRWIGAKNEQPTSHGVAPCRTARHNDDTRKGR